MIAHFHNIQPVKVYVASTTDPLFNLGTLKALVRQSLNEIDSDGRMDFQGRRSIKANVVLVAQLTNGKRRVKL